MWQTPSKSAGTTMVLSSLKQNDFQQEQNEIPMVIASNSKYEKLFNRIYKSQEKAYESISEQNRKNQIKDIKKAITERVRLTKKNNAFLQKFGTKGSKNNHWKVLSKLITPVIGKTGLEEADDQMNEFFFDINKAVALDQQARLVQFYLRDCEKKKSEIGYIEKMELNSNHRRIMTPKTRQDPIKLYHNQQEYQNQKNKVYIRHDKLKDQALKIAKKCPTYVRYKNFQRKSYIGSSINHNLLANRKIETSEQKQKRYNLIRRCFVQLAECSQSRRIYYSYIEIANLSQVYLFLFPSCKSIQQSNNEPATFESFTKIVNTIIKYKYQKVLHIEDFNQLITILFQKFNYKALEIIENRQNMRSDRIKKRIIYEQIQQFKIQKEKQIQQILKSKKIEAAFNSFYNQQKSKLIGRKYLSILPITDFMKKHGIIPKTVIMSKYVCTCMWYQNRHEGFDLSEFMKIQIALSLQEDCSLEGLKHYFQKFDIAAIVNQ